jgi:hypothetical protein
VGATGNHRHPAAEVAEADSHHPAAAVAAVAAVEEAAGSFQEGREVES